LASRGNPDLLIFVIVVLAISVRGWGHHLTLLAAGILKLFPVFAALGLVRRDKRAVIAVGGVVAFAAVTWRDMFAIYDVTQKGDRYSYGSKVLLDHEGVSDIIGWGLAIVL
jgi:hypothetical protein